MWPVLAPTTVAVDSTTPDCFCKDGRKIRVGDCALFKPPQDTPPFIGIIRSLKFAREENLKLVVNWLYRPADVKLGKGILLEAAPNEVFYSFHKDEILAASLLHPCKVAFLRKGSELPSGVSSFVCRRVYDIENKCLWWLTDKDYIDERQEEVDKLLEKTRLEMHGAVQSGGRSPKPLNGPASIPQLKPVSETVQNSSSFSSQGKGKKRERGEQGSDSAKRERLSKTEDVDHTPFRQENILKSEIAKITDKGGLVDFEGVEKLVQLMHPDGSEKKIDLAARILLVEVIAVTDRCDCLGRFVQQRGLPVLDEWLQEVHKGKICDGSSPKESDKSVDEFLLALLRALDKLPVNLQALQMCNVGKSVNLLRTHKNSEIQRKARTLVDTWKKRVEAEMNMIDSKSGSNRGVSWPGKPVSSEVTQAGNRKTGGSSEVVFKNSFVQPSASKSPTAKLGPVDTAAKFTSSSPIATKSLTSVGNNLKDPNSKMGVGSSDRPLTPTKDEKSGSSSQSQNNSQSCSSDHAKTVGSSFREDARSSTAGSLSANKISSGASRNRNSSNGLHGSAISGVPKETMLGKFSSLNRNLSSEKASPTRVTHERVVDVPSVDHGNGQRLIVRLPNTGRSPARSVSGGSFDDPSATFCRSSSPAQPERHGHRDRKAKGKSDVLRANTSLNANTELCEGKGGLAGSDEDNGSPAGFSCDEHRRIGEDGDKLLPGVPLRSGKSYEASFSSINALVESCVKFSETSTSTSPGDDMGMNLLASVAAREMSKSGVVSPSGSPGSSRSPVPEDSCSGNEAKDTVCTQGQPNDGASCGPTAEQVNTNDSLQAKNRLQHSGGSNVTLVGSEEKTGECSVKVNPSSMGLQCNSEDRKCIDASVEATKECYSGAGEKALENGVALVSEADATSGTEENKELPLENVVHKESSSVLMEQKPVLKEGKCEEANDVMAGSQVEPNEKQINDSGPLITELKIEHAEECVNPTEQKLDRITDGPEDHHASSSAAGSDMGVKMDFDLNEGFPEDDESQGEPLKSPVVPLSSQLPFLTSGSFPASVTVAAAAKGPFVPPENLMRPKSELGWKGSAATSAFRPAEPRKLLEMPLNAPTVEVADNSKPGRHFLDFDLNVADERVLDEVGSPTTCSGSGRGGLDLDLNRVDESLDSGQLSVSNGYPYLSGRSSLSINEVNVSRNNFDLNNGPSIEEFATETASSSHHQQYQKPNVPFLSYVPGLRMNNTELSNFSSWFPQGASCSAMTIPSILPSRLDQSYQSGSSQRILTGPSPGATTSFVPEMYRGPVLSSSPANQFQYPSFPFETSFPLSSMDSSSGGPLCFPTIPSQLVGSSSHYPRPYVMNLPGGGGGGGMNESRKWGGSQVLDLNAGPGGVSDLAQPSAMRQVQTPVPVAGSQGLVEEQLKMYHQMAGGGMLKRKDPEGGWDPADRFSYKHPSWQ